MVKKVFFVLLIFFVGCTTDQIKSFDRIFGVDRVLGLFEVDVNSSEKQTFVIDKPREPSFLGRSSDGKTLLVASLCFDTEGNTSDLLPSTLEASIKVSMTMGEVPYYGEMKSEHSNSKFCWWLDKRDGIQQWGWGIGGVLLPPETNFSSPLYVEIQIIDDKDSILKKLARIYSNPYLMVVTSR
jgi:hypothetical protein